MRNYKIILLCVTPIMFVLIALYLKQEETFDRIDSVTECYEKCNVILIFEDTLSAKHMGIYGNERNTTPFIDDFFSKDSFVYTNMWSTSSWTWTSFASFMRSKYLSEVTGEDMLLGKNSLIDLLRKGGIDIYAILVKPRNFIVESIYLLFKENEIVQELPENQIPLKRAKIWLETKDSQSDRFFLMIHDPTVHDPYEPPTKYRGLFNSEEYIQTIPLRGLKNLDYTDTSPTNEEAKLIKQWDIQYDQEIRYFDSMVEDLVLGMSQELLDNTIIILMSDHGEAFNEHGRLLHQNLYEEVVHIPFIVRVPNLGPTITINEPRSLIGLTPTILSMMNISYSSSSFSGMSFLFNENDNTSEIIKAERSKSFQREMKLTSTTTLKDFQLKFEEKIVVGLQMISLRDQNVSIIYTSDGAEIYLLDRDPFQKNPLDLDLNLLTESEKKIATRLIVEAVKSFNK